MILASHADILLARHAIFPPNEERLRDEPKECLRGRLICLLVTKWFINYPLVKGSVKRGMGGTLKMTDGNRYPAFWMLAPQFSNCY